MQDNRWIEWPSTNASDLEYQVEAFKAVAWRVTRLRHNPHPRYYDHYFALRRQYSGRYLYSQSLGRTYLPTFTSLKFVQWDEYSSRLWGSEECPFSSSWTQCPLNISHSYRYSRPTDSASTTPSGMKPLSRFLNCSPIF